MSIDPVRYTTRFTREWSPSRRGPKRKPEPKRATEMEGQVVLRLRLVLLFLLLPWLQWGFSRGFLEFEWRWNWENWREWEKPNALIDCILEFVEDPNR